MLLFLFIEGMFISTYSGFFDIFIGEKHTLTGSCDNNCNKHIWNFSGLQISNRNTKTRYSIK